MAPRIAYTPHKPPAQPPRPVRRRILFYLPGYDPDAKRRYHALFVRELRRYTTRFGLAAPRMSRATTSLCGHAQTWDVSVGTGELRTDTTYTVMLWDDLVRRDMARSHLLGTCLNALALLHAAATGTLIRLYRANWKCGNVILYPFVMTLLLLAAFLLLAITGHIHLTASLDLPAWLALGLGLGAGLIALRALAPWLSRAYLWQLMHDGVFHWQHARGRRNDYLARLDVFAAHILDRIHATQADEILLVGHSTGALTAVELAARLLERDPKLGLEGPVLSLLTLGSSLPLVAMQPQALTTRAEVRSLVTSQRLGWVDFQAPQDWMNFPGFNPVRDLDLGVPETGIANPLIRSAKFREIIAPDLYHRISLQPFRMHFQFLMANDAPGVFDIFALTLGGRCLRDRVMSDDVSILGSARQRTADHLPPAVSDAIPERASSDLDYAAARP